MFNSDLKNARGQSIKITAVIPARGGSKGVIKKNLATVGGKPLIAWSIETALACTRLDRVIVNTDDLEIAEVAKSYGADVPFIRPSNLAQDDSPVFEALIYGLDVLEAQGYFSSHTMQLNPTSPLRVKDHIDQSIDLLISESADSVVAVKEASNHPYWCKTIEGNRLKDFMNVGPDQYKIRQQLPKAFSLTGSIFLTSNTLIRQGTHYSPNTVPLIIPPEFSLDIDTQWELDLANLILAERAKQ